MNYGSSHPTTDDVLYLFHGSQLLLYYGALPNKARDNTGIPPEGDKVSFVSALDGMAMMNDPPPMCVRPDVVRFRVATTVLCLSPKPEDITSSDTFGIVNCVGMKIVVPILMETSPEW